MNQVAAVWNIKSEIINGFSLLGLQLTFAVFRAKLQRGALDNTLSRPRLEQDPTNMFFEHS